MRHRSRSMDLAWRCSSWPTSCGLFAGRLPLERPAVVSVVSVSASQLQPATGGRGHLALMPWDSSAPCYCWPLLASTSTAFFMTAYPPHPSRRRLWDRRPHLDPVHAYSAWLRSPHPDRRSAHCGLARRRRCDGISGTAGQDHGGQTPRWSPRAAAVSGVGGR